MNTEDFDLHRPKAGDPEPAPDIFKKFFEDPILAIMPRLDGIGRQMSYRFKSRYNGGATRKGSKHVQGATFKSVSLLGISPAEYRRRHLGKAK